MSIKNVLAAAVLTATAPAAVLAAPITALGTYTVENVAYGNDPTRGVWTEGALDGLVTGGNASRFWDVESTPGTFTISEDNGDYTAVLNGVATNIGLDGNLISDLQFEYNLEYDFEDDLLNNPQDGFCQYDWPVFPCSDPSTPANVDVAVWDFFYLTSGSFKFLNAYSGVEYDVADRSLGIHKGQAGINANALTADDRLGFSMWYIATATSMPAFSTYTFAQSDEGDFNVNLSPAAIPLPAAGWMLIAGLGGLAAMKRRKHS